MKAIIALQPLPLLRSPIPFSAALAVFSTTVPFATAAQEARVSVNAGARYEDNVRRVNDEARKELPADGADNVYSVSAQASLATRIGGMTNILGQAGAGYTWFARNSDLDAFNYDLRLEGDRTTPRNSLRVSLEQIRRRIELQDVSTDQVGIQNLTLADLDVSQEISRGFRLVGGATYLRSTTSIPERRQDNERYTLEGGFGYYSPTGNSIALTYVRSDTRALRDTLFFDQGTPLLFRSRNRDEAVALKIEYVHSPASSVDARIGYAKHNDRSILDADFEGLLADVAVTWSPRENLVIKPSFSRSFATENSLFNNGIKVTRFAIEASGILGSLISWRAKAEREKRAFRYDLSADVPESLARTDRISRISIAADYRLKRRLRLGLQYNYFTRSSELENFDFDSNSVMLTISYDFIT